MKKSTLLVTAVLIVGFAIAIEAQIRKWPTISGEPVTIQHGDQERRYRIHVPKGYDGKTKIPVVLFLHGGGGTDEQASRMGLTPLADKHQFVAVYPNAINKHWNDGRESQRFIEHDRTIDDVAFLIAVLEDVSKKYNVDKTRVFAAGASNGGFMTQRLAIERSEVFAAVGIHIATMGEPLSKRFNPEHPVSILFMNGTKDPLVPYDGGEVVVDLFPNLSKLSRREQPSRGKCISTDDAVALWVKRNGLMSTQPKRSKIADSNKDDESTVEQLLWTGGEQGTAVALYRVEGGGHAVPGGTQYLPARVIGQTNRDIDGLEVMWLFFASHARKATR